MMFYVLIVGTHLNDYDDEDVELDYYYSSSEEHGNLMRSVSYVESWTLKNTYLNIFDILHQVLNLSSILFYYQIKL